MQGMGNKILEEGIRAVREVLTFFKGFLDGIVVPLAVAALGISLLFCILSYSNAKKQHNGEDLEDKTKSIVIILILLVFVGGYGVLFGNLLSGFGG